MKKNKKTLYLLIVVIVIYTTIIFRFFMMNNEENSDDLKEFVTMDFIPEAFTTTQEFTIVNDYRDPFLSSSVKVFKKVSSSKSLPKKSKKKDSIIFPKIKYKGLVSNTNGNEKIFAVVVENREYVVSKGRIVGEVEILSGSSSEIELRFKGEERVFEIE